MLRSLITIALFSVPSLGQEVIKDITQSISLQNPSKYWHGEGARFELRGLKPVPAGCGSHIRFLVQLSDTKGVGSSMCTYAYLSGFTKEQVSGSTKKYIGIEAGIGNGVPMVVQNPARDGRYQSYHGQGSFEGFRKTAVEAGFNRTGHLFSVFDQSYKASASTSDMSELFDTYRSYKFQFLYLGVAYPNAGEPELKENDTFFATLSSKATQMIDCEGKNQIANPITFAPLNRISGIEGASEIYKVSKPNGDIDYVVVVAQTKKKRSWLLERMQRN